MPAELEKQLKKLNIKQPERVVENIVLYPRGIVLKTTKNIQKKQIDLDRSIVGPKPLNINKFIKNKKLENKVIKRNVRAGKKHQLQKAIDKFKKLVEICITDEEREKYNILLNRSKNDLNRLRKGKKILNK